ncbi:hypothetical protein MALU111345_10515 [Marinicrinis lubricantis]
MLPALVTEFNRSLAYENQKGGTPTFVNLQYGYCSISAIFTLLLHLQLNFSSYNADDTYDRISIPFNYQSFKGESL